MKNNTIIVGAEDYKYPSNEEREEAENSYPNLSNFGFDYKNELVEILKNKKSLSETKKEVNLFWWDNCLLNKFGKLHLSYINTYVNYMRYSSESEEILKKGISIHRLQFDFYSETYYYFLFSARDVIFQILNLFYNLDIEESRVSFKTITKKMINNNVREMILKLDDKLKVASEIRNSFTHKFPKNQKDYRMTHTKLSAMSGQEMKPLEIWNNISESLQIMDTWINELRQYLSIKTPRDDKLYTK